MTVGELITLLSEQDPTAEVYFEDPETTFGFEINQVIEDDNGTVFLTI